LYIRFMLASPRRSHTRRALLLLLAGPLATACTDTKPAAMSRRQFVDVYVQLVQARIDAAGDSVAYAAKRDRVFIDAHLKAADLRAFVESGREDPVQLRDAWRDIAARLDTLYGGVTSRPPPGLRDALRTRGDTTHANPRVVVPGATGRVMSDSTAGAAGADSAKSSE
jgi:hypothetical protein